MKELATTVERVAMYRETAHKQVIAHAIAVVKLDTLPVNVPIRRLMIANVTTVERWATSQKIVQKVAMVATGVMNLIISLAIVLTVTRQIRHVTIAIRKVTSPKTAQKIEV